MLQCTIVDTRDDSVVCDGSDCAVQAPFGYVWLFPLHYLVALGWSITAPTLVHYKRYCLICLRLDLCSEIPRERASLNGCFVSCIDPFLS